MTWTLHSRRIIWSLRSSRKRQPEQFDIQKHQTTLHLKYCPNATLRTSETLRTPQSCLINRWSQRSSISQWRIRSNPHVKANVFIDIQSVDDIRQASTYFVDQTQKSQITRSSRRSAVQIYFDRQVCHDWLTGTCSQPIPSSIIRPPDNSRRVHKQSIQSMSANEYLQFMKSVVLDSDTSLQISFTTHWNFMMLWSVDQALSLSLYETYTSLDVAARKTSLPSSRRHRNRTPSMSPLSRPCRNQHQLPASLFPVQRYTSFTSRILKSNMSISLLSYSSLPMRFRPFHHTILWFFQREVKALRPSWRTQSDIQDRRSVHDNKNVFL